MGHLIVIAGPTASGKTSLSISIAQKLNCPIVSADSRQLYKELKIAVARPTEYELSQAEHFFFASHSIHSPINAGEYEKEVILLLENLFKKHENVILCGGTGLYIKAVLEGLDELPNSSKEIRTQLNELFEKEGIGALQNRLKNADPEFYKTAEIENPQRLIRAIETAELSNKSNVELRKNKKKKRDFSVSAFCIDLDREFLYERINLRLDKMLSEGLEEEARSLHKYKDLEPLKTVGYKEFFDYFEGETDFETCVELIKRNTRRYAKRQLTWFRNQGDFKFASPEQILDFFK